jgi:glycosidase
MKYFLFAIAAIVLLSCNHTTVPAVENKSTNGLMTEPDWVRHAVLYECNVRQFSPEGNFAAVRKALPRIKDLGVTVLWLMPIHPIGVKNRKGSLGSPYSVQDYYAVNPDYGTVDDLKALVKEAHALDLKVILDWVPNHTSWDAVWMTQHPEYYTKINGNFTTPLNEHGQPTDWSDCADLDYSNPGLRQAMIAAMQHWIKTCDIDGYRVDMAGLVPNDFWAMVRPALDAVKPVFMLAEWQDEPGHFTSCFNANYGWKWKDVTRDIGSGRQGPQSLDTLLQYLNKFYPPNYYQLYFTQNHDENAWSGTEQDLYGASADAFNVLMFTWQGMTMLYDGQESGFSQKLPFFEKETIRWGDYGKTSFFQQLCALKRNNRAVGAGKNGGPLVRISTTADDAVYAFTREKDGDRVIVILNLSKDPHNITLQPGSEILGAYINVFGNSTVQVTKDMDLNLKPWEYLVLTNK